MVNLKKQTNKIIAAHTLLILTDKQNKTNISLKYCKNGLSSKKKMAEIRRYTFSFVSFM